MPPLASEQFHAITSANPECVWDALTATGLPMGARMRQVITQPA
jgi:hypothetical protein